MALSYAPWILDFSCGPAVGSDAEEIRQAVSDTTDDTSVFHQEALRPAQDVFDAVSEATRAGLFLQAETVVRALALLDALPAWVPAPEIALEQDGQIGFDWHSARGRALSLNVGPENMVGYAALDGVESSYGRVPFAGVLPERIGALLPLTLQARKTG